jgi:hypothetical protein
MVGSGRKGWFAMIRTLPQLPPKGEALDKLSIRKTILNLANKIALSRFDRHVLPQVWHRIRLESRETKPVLAAFLEDVKVMDGRHREWNLYKIAQGEVLLSYHYGRSTPHHQSLGGGGISSKEMLKLSSSGVYIPRVPIWKGKTPEDKVRIILASDCSPQIKADLISGVYWTGAWTGMSG